MVQSQKINSIRRSKMEFLDSELTEVQVSSEEIYN